VVTHAECLATRFTELQEDVLLPDAKWITLLLDCAGCAARLENWQGAKKLLTVVNGALERLIGNNGEPGRKQVSQLQKVAAVMRGFVEDWGFKGVLAVGPPGSETLAIT